MARTDTTARDRREGDRVAVRLGASLFAGGAVITVAAVVLPHPAQMDERGLGWMVAVQLLFVALLLLKPHGRADRWLPASVTYAGIVLVSAAVYFNGERVGGPPLFTEFFYVWPALYAGYFFRREALVAAIGFTAACYGIVLDAIDVHGPIAVTRWVVAVSSVAGLAAAAHMLRLQRDRLVQRLRRAVLTDPLTGVLNRRGFQEAFARELERLSRTGSPLSVLVADIDHFKALNDRFGHGAGDDALAAVGEILRETSRTCDTVARIGGEEFALLLPATPAVGAFEAAERLRTAVAETCDPAGRGLTISLGAVTCNARRSSPEELLGAADAALYEAKKAGRDRTVAAPTIAVRLGAAA